MKISEPGGHLDQLIRQTRAHHVHLSSMADLKANMLLTMASIVVTLAAPQTLNAASRFPLYVLIGFCVITILLAAYAVMPKLPIIHGHASEREQHSRFFNLLFFGDFIGMTYEEFSAEMERMMNDPSLAYEAQVREIYTLGLFLANKKYRYLRLAYLSFITGILACTASYIVTAYL